tara:strand:- start:4201 stop:4479 length:279 start_codon:yes stop_codon:yes gene_type:complete
MLVRSEAKPEYLCWPRDQKIKYKTNHPRPFGLTWEVWSDFCFSELTINGTRIVRCTLMKDLLAWVNENLDECLERYAQHLMKRAQEYKRDKV